jgi:hypothetical protein
MCPEPQASVHFAIAAFATILLQWLPVFDWHAF